MGESYLGRKHIPNGIYPSRLKDLQPRCTRNQMLPAIGWARGSAAAYHSICRATTDLTQIRPICRSRPIAKEATQAILHLMLCKTGSPRGVPWRSVAIKNLWVLDLGGGCIESCRIFLQFKFFGAKIHWGIGPVKPLHKFARGAMCAYVTYVSAAHRPRILDVANC